MNLRSRLLSALGKRNNIPVVEELMHGGASLADPEVLTAALTHYSGLVSSFVSSPQFSEYVLAGNNLPTLLDALYNITSNARGIDTILQIIKQDQRDKQHSVSYLWIFRRALRDGNDFLVRDIIKEVGYPADVLADVIDMDIAVFHSDAFVEDYARPDRSTYYTVLEEIQNQDIWEEKFEHMFSHDYILYRVLIYTSVTELLADLFVLDDAAALWYVRNLTGDIVNSYIDNTQYLGNGDMSSDNVMKLVRMLVRLQPRERTEIYNRLEVYINDHYGVYDSNMINQMRSERDAWDKIDRDEASRNAYLDSVRSSIISNAVLVSARDQVKKITDDISKLQSSVSAGYKKNITRIIEDRYRYVK